MVIFHRILYVYQRVGVKSPKCPPCGKHLLPSRSRLEKLWKNRMTLVCAVKNQFPKRLEFRTYFYNPENQIETTRTNHICTRVAYYLGCLLFFDWWFIWCSTNLWWTTYILITDSILPRQVTLGDSEEPAAGRNLWHQNPFWMHRGNKHPVTNFRPKKGIGQNLFWMHS